MTNQEKAIVFLQEWNLLNPLAGIVLQKLSIITKLHPSVILIKINELADRKEENDDTR